MRLWYLFDGVKVNVANSWGGSLFCVSSIWNTSRVGRGSQAIPSNECDRGGAAYTDFPTSTCFIFRYPHHCQSTCLPVSRRETFCFLSNVCSGCVDSGCSRYSSPRYRGTVGAFRHFASRNRRFVLRFSADRHSTLCYREMRRDLARYIFEGVRTGIERRL